jgi:hypothetical protein
LRPYDVALGVGKNEDPIAAVGRADVACANTVPRCIVPERGQVAEDAVESSNTESCDVLHERVPGS